MIDNPNGPLDLGIGDQLLINLLAQFGRELFRILQLTMAEPFRQHNGRGYHWSGKRTSPGFVNASDSADSDGAQLFLVSKTASPVHAKQSWADRAHFHAQNHTRPSHA